MHKDTGKESGTIKLVIPEKRKLISIELDGNNYNLAIDAHKNGKMVTLKGDLEKRSRTQLTNISEMKIFELEEL